MTEKALRKQNIRDQQSAQEGYREQDPIAGYQEPSETEWPSPRYLSFINTTEDYLRDVASVRAYYAEGLERPVSSSKLPNFEVLIAELQTMHTWAVASEGIAREILQARNVPFGAKPAASDEPKANKKNRKPGSSTTSGL